MHGVKSSCVSLLIHLPKPICDPNSGLYHACAYRKESFKNIAKNQRHRAKKNKK